MHILGRDSVGLRDWVYYRLNVTAPRGCTGSGCQGECQSVSGFSDTKSAEVLIWS